MADETVQCGCELRYYADGRVDQRWCQWHSPNWLQMPVYLKPLDDPTAMIPADDDIDAMLAEIFKLR